MRKKADEDLQSNRDERKMKKRRGHGKGEAQNVKKVFV